jgi:hypothetical protein
MLQRTQIEPPGSKVAWGPEDGGRIGLSNTDPTARSRR